MNTAKIEMLTATLADAGMAGDVRARTLGAICEFALQDRVEALAIWTCAANARPYSVDDHIESARRMERAMEVHATALARACPHR